MSSAIWNAIPSLSPNGPSPCAPPSRHAASKSFPVLSAQPIDHLLGRRVGPARLPPLHRLAADERETRVGEHAHEPRVAGLRELREGAGEQVVAGSAGGGRPVRRPDGTVPAAQLGPVDQVVVDERRQVHELDGGARRHRRRRPGRRGEEDEQRPQPLAARGERLAADGARDAVVPRHGLAEALLQLLHVGVQPGCVERDRRHA